MRPLMPPLARARRPSHGQRALRRLRAAFAIVPRPPLTTLAMAVRVALLVSLAILLALYDRSMHPPTDVVVMIR